jgi:ferritin-like metal-binding protein YciE
MAMFARFQPDTPGKLIAHASAYERMEFAAYDLLARLADRAGDAETAQMARLIEEQERTMAERLAASFDNGVAAALAEHPRDDIEKQLGKYLADAHAIEQQAIKLLEKAPKIVEAEGVARAFEEHLEETHHHLELLEAQLRARGQHSSTLKDAALKLGALNLGMFFGVQVDTPAKLTAFAYAFEHLEIASYELLSRVAAKVHDDETIACVDKILLQERAAAARLYDLFGEALDASLEAAGVTV